MAVRNEAEAFFMQGMSEALTAMRNAATDEEPLAIYYAFKQSELAEEGIISAGWASFLQAVVDAGLTVDGTWPVRTELSNRMIGRGTPTRSLRRSSSSAASAPKPRIPSHAPNSSARLKREMPDAIDDDPQGGRRSGRHAAVGHRPWHGRVHPLCPSAGRR